MPNLIATLLMLVAHAVSPYNPLRLAAPSAPATTSRFLFFRIQACSRYRYTATARHLPVHCSDLRHAVDVNISDTVEVEVEVYSSLLESTLLLSGIPSTTVVPSYLEVVNNLRATGG